MIACDYSYVTRATAMMTTKLDDQIIRIIPINKASFLLSRKTAQVGTIGTN